MTLAIKACGQILYLHQRTNLNGRVVLLCVQGICKQELSLETAVPTLRILILSPQLSGYRLIIGYVCVQGASIVQRGGVLFTDPPVIFPYTHSHLKGEGVRGVGGCGVRAEQRGC